MELRQLEAFVAVATELHFGGLVCGRIDVAITCALIPAWAYPAG